MVLAALIRSTSARPASTSRAATAGDFFDSDATLAAVQALVQAITFSTSGETAGGDHRGTHRN